MTSKHAPAMRFAKNSTRILFAWLLALAAALSLSACKPTDFFTEVIITPFAETVDENNEDSTTVNSPDAEEESSLLSALDWTDESPRSYETQNLVVYSSDPNSALTSHHSIFSLSPLFAGIEASDGVKLVYDDAAATDHEAEASEDDASSTDAQSESTAGDSAEDAQLDPDQDASSDAQTAQSDEGALDESTSGGNGQTSGSGSNTEDGENGNGEGSSSQGDNGDDTDGSGGGSGGGSGTEEDPYAGYGGSVSVYNPGDAFSEVQQVDHLAVLGTDAAVIAQAIGGDGAICAMSEYAWYGLDSDGQRTTASYFGEMFADQASSVQILWSEDGSSPSCLADVATLVEACGNDGVIVYDQRLGDQTTLFSDDQRRELYAANIQLVPVDLSSVQGILDAATVIGDALAASTECAKDSDAVAEEYVDAVSALVSAAAATHGGSLAVAQSSPSAFLTSYNSCPTASKVVTSVNCYIATESQTGLTLASNALSMDVSDIVLFQNNGNWDETPLMFWEQVAGVWDGSCDGAYAADGLSVLWPVFQGASASSLSGSGGAYSQWLGSSPVSSNSMSYYSNAGQSSTAYPGDGLGSANVPYLVVCASDGKSAAEVKSLVVSSMTSRMNGGSLTPYSILPSTGEYPTDSSTNAVLSIGAVSNGSGSPFYTSGLAAANVVVENPVGLLGSWTEGSMESVLECVWLADVYSRTPTGCSYSPLCDMGKFSVTIGNATCTSTRDAVLAFYETFYGVDASSMYESVVTDEGR